MTLTLEERIKKIMKERKSWIIMGCRSEERIFNFTAQSYRIETGEAMQLEDYRAAVKIMYEEKK